MNNELSRKIISKKLLTAILVRCYIIKVASEEVKNKIKKVVDKKMTKCYHIKAVSNNKLIFEN